MQVLPQAPSGSGHAWPKVSVVFGGTRESANLRKPRTLVLGARTTLLKAYDASTRQPTVESSNSLVEVFLAQRSS